MTLWGDPCEVAPPVQDQDAQAALAREEPHLGLALDYVRAQISQGNCARAWSSANASGHKILIDEVRAGCGSRGLPPGPPAPARPIVLW